MTTVQIIGKQFFVYRLIEQRTHPPLQKWPWNRNLAVVGADQHRVIASWEQHWPNWWLRTS